MRIIPNYCPIYLHISCFIFVCSFFSSWLCGFVTHIIMCPANYFKFKLYKLMGSPKKVIFQKICKWDISLCCWCNKILLLPGKAVKSENKIIHNTKLGITISWPYLCCRNLNFMCWISYILFNLGQNILMLSIVCN